MFRTFVVASDDILVDNCPRWSDVVKPCSPSAISLSLSLISRLLDPSDSMLIQSDPPEELESDSKSQSSHARSPSASSSKFCARRDFK